MLRARVASPRRGRSLAIVTSLVLVALLAGPAVASDAGFRTGRDAMLQARWDGVTVKPLISVGDTIGSYQFQGIPDGIAVRTASGQRAEIYVNHETSKVPFQGFADTRNSEVSLLTVKRGNGKILAGEMAIDSSAGYQRFCSSFLAGPEQDFTREIYFAPEEATDTVSRKEDSWPATTSPEQAGVVVAYDVASGDHRTIYGMGRHNHENAVAIPGYGKPVVLSGDDTFSAPSSQMYLYVADNTSALWNDDAATTQLYAFKADVSTENDYGDVTAGESISGEFISVPDSIAYGAQTPLESWSNTNNIFQFIRIEDIAYDRDDPNVVYFTDTGEPRALPQTAGVGGNPPRLFRGPTGTRGDYMNGRLWKMVLDPNDPREVLSLSILPGANFDLDGYDSAGTPHQPDNLETVRGGILFQEDPGNHNGGAAFSNARLWYYDLATHDLSVVAEVDQSQSPALANGTWESSGIVDASAAFGGGAFLVTVQAHNRNFWQAASTTTKGGVTYRERVEDGQLLLVRIPQLASR